MPQIENGYTKIANELLEALAKFRMPGEARQVFDFIIRKTYGFNKKRDAIPLSQFEKGTGLIRPNICRGIKTLEEMNLIFRHKGKSVRQVTEYEINKKFETWGRSGKDSINSDSIEIDTSINTDSIETDTITSIEIDNITSIEIDTLKRNYTKEITKEREEKKESKKKPAFEIPENLHTPTFLKEWEAFVSHRIQIKRKMTDEAARRILKKLSGWGERKAIEAINESIEKSWTGVFDPDRGNKSGLQEEKELTLEEIGAMYE